MQGASKIDMLRPRRCLPPPYWNFCIRTYTPWVKYIYVPQPPFFNFQPAEFLCDKFAKLKKRRVSTACELCISVQEYWFGEIYIL